MNARKKKELPLNNKLGIVFSFFISKPTQNMENPPDRNYIPWHMWVILLKIKYRTCPQIINNQFQISERSMALTVMKQGIV